MKRQINYIIITISLTVFGSCLIRTANQAALCADGRFAAGSEIAHAFEKGCKDAELGRLYDAQGRRIESAKFYQRAALRLPELADYFMLAKANVELKNRNFAEARSIAEALLDTHKTAASGTFAKRVNQVLATIAVVQKDHLQIIKTHELLLSQGFGEQEALLFNLATSLKHMGQSEKADEIYKKLLVLYPASAEAEQIEKLISLSHLELTNKENETRFNKLIQSLTFAKIVSEADQKLARMDDPEKSSILNGYAIKSLMLNNQFEQGIKRAQKSALKKNATPKDLETYAWSLGKVNRHMDAADSYAKLMTNAEDAENKTKGCFFAGFSLYEASLYSMAQFSWQKCKSLMENSAYHESFLWYQAFSAILNHDLTLAYKKLAEINDTFKKSEHKEKYAYFTAYILHLMGKKNAGDALFGELAKEKKPSYYVLQARNFLGLTDISGVELQGDALLKLAGASKNPDLKKALMLFHLGFLQDAKDLILSAKTEAQEKLAALQHVGLFHEAWQRSYLLSPQVAIADGSIKTAANIRARYPLPHQPIIKQKSEKYGVKQNLLYAVMQKESGFLHDAQSNRGALGLMQMMPFVAYDLAEKLAIDAFSAERLREPEISIELGALLIATLSRQFEKNHLVLAAYNAGPHQVQRWLNNFGHLPPELFIERIPFEQTRTYVKEVLLLAGIYNSLQGQPLRLTL